MQLFTLYRCIFILEYPITEKRTVIAKMAKLTQNICNVHLNLRDAYSYYVLPNLTSSSTNKSSIHVKMRNSSTQ